MTSDQERKLFTVITVKSDKESGPMKKYSRVETVADVEVECFDGEGLISKQYAKVIDNAFCGKHIHHSFQIRMLFVKGMLHKVYFKDFLESCGEETITDIWCIEHNFKDWIINLMNTGQIMLHRCRFRYFIPRPRVLGLTVLMTLLRPLQSKGH